MVDVLPRPASYPPRQTKAMAAAGIDAAVDAAASESSLVLPALPASGAQTFGAQTFSQTGPCLFVGMGEAGMVERMNAWGVAREQEALDLRSSLAATQAVVSTVPYTHPTLPTKRTV